MQRGDTIICDLENTSTEGILIDPKVLVQGKEYILEAFDNKHVTKGDGPQNIRFWTMIKLKGVKESQWLRFFKLKEK